jgi:hypothetical protein
MSHAGRTGSSTRGALRTACHPSRTKVRGGVRSG